MNLSRHNGQALLEVILAIGLMTSFAISFMQWWQWQELRQRQVEVLSEIKALVSATDRYILSEDSLPYQLRQLEEAGYLAPSHALADYRPRWHATEWSLRLGPINSSILPSLPRHLHNAQLQGDFLFIYWPDRL